MTENSILTEIKKLLGIEKDYEAFDTDIKIYINSALARLSQLGVNTSEKLQITGYDEVWDDLFGDNDKLNFIQEYVYLKVKTVFDPPTSATVLEAFKSRIDQLEWEINVEADKT